MKRYLISILALTALNSLVYSQPSLKEMVKGQSRIAGELVNAVEGFGNRISGEEITYHSTRQDCQNALLVRATDGKMAVSWYTPVLIPETGSGAIQLFLIAGMSLQGYSTKGVDPGFTVFINGRKFFHFRNSMGENWKVEGPQSSSMIFQTVLKDQANDGFGYARIEVPSDVIETGKQAEIRIVGDSTGSRHWFMVFQCPDALEWFRRKNSIDCWLDINLTESEGKLKGTISVPDIWAGSELILTMKDGKKITLGPVKSVNGTVAVFVLPLTTSSISLKCPGGLVISDIDLRQVVSKSIVQRDRLISYQETQPAPGSWLIQLQAAASSVSDDLSKISGSPIVNGKIEIIASSHQDIAWMDSPQACVENRDNLLITPALKILDENPSYYNDMEDILMLREYLGRHPDKKELIYRLTSEGRLKWGASYIQPYEEMYFGEPLIRQFYLGRKWFRKEFPGCDARIYWNVDVPGRTLQMPQILAGCGVNYMIISRQDQGLFNWTSPDGSRVLTYSPGHYYNSYVNLKKGFFESVRHFADLTGFWEKYYTPATVNPVIPVLSDADMAVPDSYFDYINTWNSMKSPSLKLPSLVHSTAEKFLDDAVATGASFPTIQGERPAVWLYIHGPSHYEALKAGRSAGRLLPAAEKMASFCSMVTGNWDHYPTDRLTKAWESAIYPDHGWGGKNGDITDQTFLDKFREADQIAKSLIQESTTTIASKVLLKQKGMPLVIFNSLSWMRTDPVEVRLSFPDQFLKGINIIDNDAKPVEFQVSGTVEHYPSGYLKVLPVTFVAANIPSLGYRTFYVTPGKPVKAGPEGVSCPQVVETDYYRIRLGKGGLESLFDKLLQKEMLETDQFRAGELFSLHSFGNGAGEFADIQQPDTAGFEKPGIGPVWTIVEFGPVKMVMEGSARMNHNSAKVTWTVYHKLRRIDVKVDLIDWDGTAYREFRLAFPAGMQNPEITYEVPFGVVRVGKDELAQAAGERYTMLCKDVHPRGINNWISANDSDKGITISSPVAVWDYVNMTGLQTSATLLQPILLASRQSCHGEGPLYHQKGSHSMEFSLFTHQPGWQNGYRQALQANEKLTSVFNAVQGTVELPDQLSFISVDDPDTPISTIKKCEDDNSLIIRLYDQIGSDKLLNINVFKKPVSVEKTDLLEENGKAIKAVDKGLSVRIGHNAIETFKIRF